MTIASEFSMDAGWVWRLCEPLATECNFQFFALETSFLGNYELILGSFQSMNRKTTAKEDRRLNKKLNSRLNIFVHASGLF